MGLSDVVTALMPTVGLSVLFYFVIKKVINADRNERAAQAQMEEQERKDSTEVTDK